MVAADIHPDTQWMAMQQAIRLAKTLCPTARLRAQSERDAPWVSFSDEHDGTELVMLTFRTDEQDGSEHPAYEIKRLI